MSEDDLKTNAKVRKILVENNLDLSLLGVSTSSGAVTIRGELKKLSRREMSDHDVSRLLGVLESVMLRTKGVRRVTFAIKSWKKAKGKWSKS
jgi:hypothetical protein